MTPLPFVWPYALLFWAVMVWAYSPEYRIVRKARKRAASVDSPDAGSVRLIVIGTGIAILIAFPLAWVPVLRLPEAVQPFVFFLGLGILVGGSLLRRHCFRLLGSAFTGDVYAHREQAVVQSGAYAVVRHPSYTAGILMSLGMGLTLGSWGSAVLLVLGALVVYGYRIAVEERTLSAVIGEPYREYMRTRWRLIPFIY